MKTVSFLGYECGIQILMYSNGRTAIQLLVMEDGLVVEPMCVATVNLPMQPLESNHVFIKDYSENAGILQCLTDAGVITPTGSVVACGHAQAHLCKFHRENC